MEIFHTIVPPHPPPACASTGNISSAVTCHAHSPPHGTMKHHFAYRWGNQMLSLFCICHAQEYANLLDIWYTIVPLSKDMARASM